MKQANQVHQPVTNAPLHDFGGEGPIIHLAHANGFPPGTYRPLAEALTDRYRVIGLGLRPLWPNTQPESAPDWHSLAADLIRELDLLGLRNIFGVGHSLGGVVTLWTAILRPDLFRAVVLVDPVVLPPDQVWLWRLLRLLGLHRRQPLIRRTLHRRRLWSSRQHCFQHYRAKPLFATWPDSSLWAYVEAGTRERADGQVELVYPPEWEAHIFATIPTDVWQAVPHLHTPALIIRGEHSHTFPHRSLVRMKRMLPQARFSVIPQAGHLVPMEQPAETAKAIRHFLEHCPACGGLTPP